MRDIKVAIVFLFTLFFITGCSSSIDKLGQNDEYLSKSASKSKSIVVPKDLNANAVENYYPIPKIKSKDDQSTANTLAIPPRVNPNIS